MRKWIKYGKAEATRHLDYLGTLKFCGRSLLVSSAASDG
jgi:hypothetical protein